MLTDNVPFIGLPLRENNQLISGDHRGSIFSQEIFLIKLHMHVAYCVILSKLHAPL